MSINSKIKSHLPHQNLAKKFWVDEQLRPAIRERLLVIANEFVDYLGVEIDVIDITFTGSFANYNYTRYSDIDLHIIIDKQSINKDIDLVEEFLKAKRQYWNDKHDIKVESVEVELYPQDDDEPHKSSGVYSIKNDEWVVKPKKFVDKFSENDVQKKVLLLKKKIDAVIEKSKYKKDPEDIDELLQKIRKMRQSGLEKSGEMSEENIAYKTLRADGDIDRLYDMLNNIYDIKLSVG